MDMLMRMGGAVIQDGVAGALDGHVFCPQFCGFGGQIGGKGLCCAVLGKQLVLHVATLP